MAVVMSLFGLVYAKLRARLGYAALLRTSAAAWTAAFLVLGTVSQPYVLLTAPALLGFGQAVAFSAVSVLIGETAPPELRGTATSLSGTAAFAGQFLSPLLLGPIVDGTSVTTGFLAAGGLAAAVLLVLPAVRTP
jgi:MFS family permease